MSVIEYNVNTILVSILYVPSNFLLANYMYKHYGVYITMAAGSALNCVCLWFRTFINQSFTMAMVGGLFYGIAQPLSLNAGTEVAANWFDTDEVLFVS